MDRIIAAFYKFVTLDDYPDRRQPLLKLCQQQNIKGTILLAAEGINGTIAGTRSSIDTILAYLRSDTCFADLEHKESIATKSPFDRLKVRLKQEIVTLGIPTIDPTNLVGTYVTPQDWNELISNPDVLVIDTRNQYEVEIGTFKGSIDPHTSSFTEFPAYVATHLDPHQHKQIAMFCTGGIRCEKATSYLLSHGFENVYHLQGGILKYLEEIPATESQWEGECFVFDDRVAVTHGLEPGTYQLCWGCGNPISESDLTAPHYEPGICCPRCYLTITPAQRASRTQRWRQLQLAQS
ncbi:rhodanese-related sulfurtransferase [Chamaesiphon sp. VAR_48_metabat_135_sub]|uniref:oxygen-dependent tRNA uridine(34) hydroxylase TrhO n=1 Tax=Chamaesiphon sp. VAR_48_metabat_135_sub TaxID=2964699 RepID=UPI002869FCA1|nr:rhodanese-related sulfurtransferase [Chamaesiphon sp. VAR_48_metabat_135_sub]